MKGSACSDHFDAVQRDRPGRRHNGYGYGDQQDSDQSDSHESPPEFDGFYSASWWQAKRGNFKATLPSVCERHGQQDDLFGPNPGRLCAFGSEEMNSVNLLT
jgi:hypothetical protein